MKTNYIYITKIIIFAVTVIVNIMCYYDLTLYFIDTRLDFSNKLKSYRRRNYIHNMKYRLEVMIMYLTTLAIIIYFSSIFKTLHLVTVPYIVIIILNYRFVNKD